MIVDRQPRAIEPEHNKSSHDNTQALGSDIQQHTYLPVFFSPESGQIFMNVDGTYKPLPNQYFTDSVSMPRGTGLNQVSYHSIYIY